MMISLVHARRYASSLKLVALCLLYAPLWPAAYLLAALCCGLNFVGTKFAVAKWWAKPPMVRHHACLPDLMPMPMCYL